MKQSTQSVPTWQTAQNWFFEKCRHLRCWWRGHVVVRERRVPGAVFLAYAVRCGYCRKDFIVLPQGTDTLRGPFYLVLIGKFRREAEEMYGVDFDELLRLP
jgi:hypothetical protein